MVSSTCLREKLVVYIKIWAFTARCVSAILRKVIGENIWKLQSMELFLVILWWKKLRKNSVVNVEGIRCWKCSVGKMLPVMYALLIGKNGQIIIQKKLYRELSRKYGEEHKEEKKVYNQEYNQREVECEACRCKVRTCNWLRHLETRKHRDGVENGGGGGDMDVDAGGGGRTSWPVP